jgi:CheY-like chemotaxis protein
MILFVDDEVRRMRRYVDELASKGLRTTSVSSLSELQLLLQRQDQSPQCIVLDVMFPRDSLLPDELTSVGQTTGVGLEDLCWFAGNTALLSIRKSFSYVADL